MADDKPTHLPAEGEGTPLLPADSDLAPDGKPEPDGEALAPSITAPA